MGGLCLFTNLALIFWYCLFKPLTEHHFGSSAMTLNERFTKYLKKGMEQDAAKNKKSPEIHRLVPLDTALTLQKYSRFHFLSSGIIPE